MGFFSRLYREATDWQIYQCGILYSMPMITVKLLAIEKHLSNERVICAINHIHHKYQNKSINQSAVNALQWENFMLACNFVYFHIGYIDEYHMRTPTTERVAAVMRKNANKQTNKSKPSVQ